MSQVDYDQKIQEINKLKISDSEKSRRIRVLLLQKQAGEVKTAKADIITMKAVENKPIMMKATVNKPAVRLVEKPVKVVNNDFFREQLHAIHRDGSLNNEEKHAKIKAFIENKPEQNVAAVHESVERIREIHAIRKQNLNPREKMNKIQALLKKSNVRVVQQRSVDPIKEKITAVHKEHISLEEKKLRIQALMKERHA